MAGFADEAFLVMRPGRPWLPTQPLGDGTHIELLDAVPIHESDRAYNAQHGTDALIERWGTLGVAFWDPKRPDALADA